MSIELLEKQPVTSEDDVSQYLREIREYPRLSREEERELAMKCADGDEEAIRTAQRLAREEGIFCGISSGTNVAAALKLAKKLGKGKTVVTVLPDTAERYFSTPLFDE